MKWFLTICQVAAVAVAVLGAARVVRANSGDCHILVYRVNGYEYLEYRIGYPRCSPTPCDNPAKSCHEDTCHPSGHPVYRVCTCSTVGPGSGCVLGYAGPDAGGQAACVNYCQPAEYECLELGWAGQWVGGDPPQWIETAQPCRPCQAP